MKAFEKLSQHSQLVKTPNIFLKIKRLLILMLIFIFLSLVFLPWQQTSKGKGRVIAFSPSDRQQKIEAPIYGRIDQWYVQEGSNVKKGDPVVKIIDNDPKVLERLQKQRDAISKRLDALEKAAQTSNLNVTRQKTLFDKGLSSQRDYELSLLEYSKLLAEEAKVGAELNKIEIKLARQSNQTVVAPVDGIILNRMLGINSQFVKSGDPLAIIVPKTASRAVELWVDGNDMPLIRKNNKVRVQFEGWPALQFSGWPTLSFGTFGGLISFVDPTDDGTGQFRVVIIPDPADEPWPKSMYLRQGVKTLGWVLLNEVSLGYEIWRQFNGFPAGSTEQIKDTLETSKK